MSAYDDGNRHRYAQDVKVLPAGEFPSLSYMQGSKYAVYFKCSHCGYIYKETDYTRRRGGWRPGRLEKLKRTCIKCGHGGFAWPIWIRKIERLPMNAFDRTVRVMEIVEGSDVPRTRGKRWRR